MAEEPTKVISDGAALALGNALSRFLDDSRSGDVGGKRVVTVGIKRKRHKSSKKPVVLAENEEVQQDVNEEREERKKLKELRKRKLAFESNGRVIPDAATGAALEKELLGTATKGAVALFNAIAKAQRAASHARKEAINDKKKSKSKDSTPVTKQGFMNLMKAGINKRTSSSTATAMPMNMDKASDEIAKEKSGLEKKKEKTTDKETSEGEDEDDSEEESEDEDEDEVDMVNNKVSSSRGSKAKWLKDDFLVSGAKRLKDWDKPSNPFQESSDESSEEDEDHRSAEDMDGMDSAEEDPDDEESE